MRGTGWGEDMTKSENVIKGLEICSAGEWNSTGGRDHTRCPYYPAGYTGCTCKLLMRDALALLKAQEPVEPTIGGDADGPCGNWWYQCGKCKEAIDYHDRYCRNCGRAVKWE